MVKSVSIQNTVTLYWDLPDDYVEGDKYEVYSQSQIVGETEKCHYKISMPDYGCKYSFEVYHKSERGRILLGSITAFTDLKKRMIDITKPPYNAKGDGETLNTIVIQQAIDDCGAGECVYIPSGDFLTGSLRLHSNMDLCIDKNAILHGTTDVHDYEPKIKSRFEGYEMMTYAALLNIGELNRNGGYNCANIKIYGGGTVCGGGLELAENVVEREKILMKDYLDSLGEKIKEFETAKTIPGRLRPRLINVSSSQNILISDITIMNGASWNLHMIYSDNIITCGCVFRSEKVWNGDGWDPDSSTNCTLFGSEFYTGDDAVAIKSGKNPEGNIINRPCEHIRVFDCVSHYGHGITIGSEMSGGVRDVRIWNCDMENSVYGVQIKGTKKRGGYVKDISVRNCKLCRAIIQPVGYNDDGDAAPTIPVFENCRFENIFFSARLKDKNNELVDCNVIELEGFDSNEHAIKNIVFKNITINSDMSLKQNIVMKCCNGISFENIKCN